MLNGFTVFVFGDMRDQETQFLHTLNNQFAGAVYAIFPEPVQSDKFVRHQPVRRLADIRLAIEHIEHFAGCEARTLANLEIVKVMTRGNFHRAGTQLRIGMFVGNDRNAPSGNWQDNLLADNAFITIVAGMYRNRHIGQHRFRACGCDLDIVLSVIQRHAIGERIFEMPETAFGIDCLDLQIANRRFQRRVPVDQPFVAVDQTVIIEIDKNLQHGLIHAFVHGEAFVGPVH